MPYDKEPISQQVVLPGEVKEWYKINDTSQTDSPALIIFKERVMENIRTVITMAGDASRLRPHVKTHKTKEATLLMMNAGIRKFKCATIAEAEMLAICGAPDVLLAYPVSGPKLRRFRRLMEKYPDTLFSCLADHATAAAEISASAGVKPVRVFIDLNVGMNRTGIRPGNEATSLYEYCTGLNGVEVAGLHLYDGHIRETDIGRRKKICEAAFAPVKQMIEALKAKGYQPQIVAGGSPSFPFYITQQGVECSPGTFIFWDYGYSISLPEQHFLPAALVMARIVSLPDETKICIDLGYKSIASEHELTKRVIFINAPDLRMLSHSEEHLVADAGPHHAWKPGDILYGMPYHICPTVALYENALIAERGTITGKWKIVARDRSITI